MYSSAAFLTALDNSFSHSLRVAQGPPTTAAHVEPASRLNSLSAEIHSGRPGGIITVLPSSTDAAGLLVASAALATLEASGLSASTPSPASAAKTGLDQATRPATNM